MKKMKKEGKVGWGSEGERGGERGGEERKFTKILC